MQSALTPGPDVAQILNALLPRCASTGNPIAVLSLGRRGAFPARMQCRVCKPGRTMNHAEWKDVWSLVVSLIGRQSPPSQIFSWLLIAFALLMLVEGLRTTFLPRRVVAQIHRRNSREHEAGPPRKAASSEPMSPAAPRAAFTATNAARNAKRSDRALNRREPVRPKIRRTSSCFEDAGAWDDALPPQTETGARDPVLAEISPAE